MRATALRLTRRHDDALDVLQETFLYVLGKFPGLVLRSRFKTFLYPVVQHLGLRAIENRRRARPPQEPDAPTVDDLAADPPAPASATGSEALEAVVRTLAPEHREVLILRFADGLGLSEIAEACQIPIGTVKSRLHNALSRLREDPETRNLLEP